MSSPHIGVSTIDYAAGFSFPQRLNPSISIVFLDFGYLLRVYFSLDFARE